MRALYLCKHKAHQNNRGTKTNPTPPSRSDELLTPAVYLWKRVRPRRNHPNKPPEYTHHRHSATMWKGQRKRNYLVCRISTSSVLSSSNKASSLEEAPRSSSQKSPTGKYKFEMLPTPAMKSAQKPLDVLSLTPSPECPGRPECTKSSESPERTA